MRLFKVLRAAALAAAVAFATRAQAGPKPSNLDSTSRHIIYYGDKFNATTLDALDDYEVVV
ncbi:MAG TPA: hypothetical protein VE782_02910, partial [Myxococcaceae bacterium]|nr:hypothetical protein [Myxococcaceae bacterium]